MKTKRKKRAYGFFSKPKDFTKKRSKYICPFCEKERDTYDKTAIKSGKNWIGGCQECFLKSI